MIPRELRKLHGQYNKMLLLYWKYQDEGNISRKEEVDKKLLEITEEYAKAIFAYYSTKNIALKDKRTLRVVTWEEAFGKDYTCLSKQLKDSLVSLVEEDGGFFRRMENL